MRASAVLASSRRTLVRCVVVALGLFVCSFMLLSVLHAQSIITSVNATIDLPIRAGGFSGKNDSRDLDIYPTIAYDAPSQRYLAVWLSPYNGTSESSGLDVYGVFLDPQGQPIGDPFRISDRNQASRGSLPTVAGGNGAFAVAWAVRGAQCTVAVQQVTTGTALDDVTLVQGDTTYHSPHIRYDPVRQHFVLVAVAGSDYLPPTQGGADTNDCGNDVNSTSQIIALTFTFATPTSVDIATRQNVSPAIGAFRPQSALLPDSNQYLVVWEDRRTETAPYRFAVYGQRLNADLVSSGDPLVLAAAQDYQNTATDTTWTPRPAVAAGGETFLAVWFERTDAVETPTWSTVGRIVSSNGSVQDALTMDQVAFGDPRLDQAPTGFVDVVYAPQAQEYLVASATYAERLWGFLSEVRLQRISTQGHLLAFDDGSLSASANSRFLDSARTDRSGISLATDTGSHVLAAYSKHSGMTASEQDFDIWSARVTIDAGQSESSTVYLPLIRTH